MEDKPRSGRPVDEADEQIRVSAYMVTASTRLACALTNIAASTIRYTAKKYRFRRVKKKEQIHLTEKQKYLRMKFAIKYVIQFPLKFPKVNSGGY